MDPEGSKPDPGQLEVSHGLIPPKARFPGLGVWGLTGAVLLQGFWV